MGRATILAAVAGEQGLYDVRVDYGADRRDALVSSLDDDLAALAAQIVGLQITLDAFKAQEEVPARTAVDSAVDAYIAASRAVPRNDAVVRASIDAHDAALKALFGVRVRYQQLEATIAEMRLRQAAGQKRRAELIQAEASEAVRAWCADYTLDAVGDVATIDIPGESGAAVIAPGAPQPEPLDGALLARELQEGAQVFFNAAILPGWQRWMPAFRVGALTAVDVEANTADVILDDAISSAQSLPINETAALPAVPVAYMTCNAAAFRAGDRVVIKFEDQDWTKPKVIGFESHPRPCSVIYAGAEYREIYENGARMNTWLQSALIDVDRMQVIERWDRISLFPGGMVSYNGQPYWEISGLSNTDVPGGTPDSVGFDLLIDATGVVDYGLPVKASSLQQSDGRIYGIKQGSTGDNGEYRIVIEMQDVPPFEVVDSWTAVDSTGSLSTLSISDGHLAVGGWLGNAYGYGVRVFDLDNARAQILQFLVPSPVESVWVTRDYLAALHWGNDSTHRIELYRRTPSGYVFVQQINTSQYPYSMCISGNYIVAKEMNDVWVWKIDPETLAVSPHGSLQPFFPKGGEIDGRYKSGYRPDGSGTSGHKVCAVAVY